MKRSILRRARHDPSVRRGSRRAAWAILILLVTWAAGCDDDETGGVIPEVCVEFTAAAAPGPGAVTARSGADSTCAVAEVEIVATDVMGVWAARMDVLYDNTTLIFAGIDVTDSWLASDGVDLEVIRTVDSGRIIIGITRDNSQSSDPIDFTGTQLLARLTFGRLDQGASTLTFENEDLLDGSEPPGGLGTAPWSGGDFVIN